jgi:hypothetical protein
MCRDTSKRVSNVPEKIDDAFLHVGHLSTAPGVGRCVYRIGEERP